MRKRKERGGPAMMKSDITKQFERRRRERHEASGKNFLFEKLLEDGDVEKINEISRQGGGEGKGGKVEYS